MRCYCRTVALKIVNEYATSCFVFSSVHSFIKHDIHIQYKMEQSDYIVCAGLWYVLDGTWHENLPQYIFIALIFKVVF